MFAYGVYILLIFTTLNYTTAGKWITFIYFFENDHVYLI
jgi:hypothetical protein